MNTKRRSPGFGIILVLGIVVVLVSAVVLGWRSFVISYPSQRIPAAAKPDFGLMAEAWNAIHEHYVDRKAVKRTRLTYGAISGMVASLGDVDHSTFLTPDMIKQEEEFTRGEYKGIGAEIRMKNGQVTIVTPLDGSPAQKAGLKPGDVIIAVDGKDIAGLGLRQVVKKITGPVGTKVSLRILDPSTGKVRNFILQRAKITENPVSWDRISGTGIVHLRIAAFSENTTKNLKKAIEAIEKEKAGGIILDLRNNPGGLLKSAISSASQFLQNGNVLLEKNAKGQINDIPVQKGGLAPHIPMVGLVNGGTASAAEIVAGALQAHGRAKLLGTKTFGTGTVLREFPLSDGSALMLAVEEWLTPKGKTIWHKGIKPDRVVALHSGVAPLFPAQQPSTRTLQRVRQSRDSQLLAAIGLLSGKTEHSGVKDAGEDSPSTPKKPAKP
jgi:carboxyl-terminal processing protease